MYVGSVVIDCNDFVTMSAFWAEALHYVPREPAEEDWAVLRDPDGVDLRMPLRRRRLRALQRARGDPHPHHGTLERRPHRLVLSGKRPSSFVVRTKAAREEAIAIDVHWIKSARTVFISK